MHLPSLGLGLRAFIICHINKFGPKILIQPMIPKLPYHPVTVVGGGIIGKLVALSLGRILAPYYCQPLLLVTRDKPSAMTKPNSVSSNRVSFLTPGSVRFFQELGIWRKICLGGAYPISSMKVKEDIVSLYDRSLTVTFQGFSTHLLTGRFFLFLKKIANMRLFLDISFQTQILNMC